LGFLRQALVCAHHPVAQVVSLIPGDGGERSSFLVNPQT
jgi:hypothetical protein